MRYMLLIYSPEDSWTPEQWKECVETSSGICQELAEKGQLIAASPLHPVATATTVRVRDGKTIVTAGPFAETIEQLGGFYVIDVQHLDEAIQIATRLPPVKKGVVEIRPIMKIAGLPPEQFNAEPTKASWQQYMFLCYDDEEAWAKAGKAAHESAIQEAVSLISRIDAQGMFISASPLHASTTATSVRVRDGQRSITDGPFAETHEVLGGYYVIWAESQEQAMSLASQHSGARVGSVEVRQVFDVRTLDLSTTAQSQ